MKIKSYVALTLVWCTAVALWLWEMSTLAEDTMDKTVVMDPENAVQHMVNVKIIWDNWSVADASVLKIAGEQLVWIQTNNFIISKDDTNLKNTIDDTSSYSNILWWVSNTIQGWQSSTILWWESNLNKWKFSTILWWKSNKLWENSTSEYSTIVGWTSNRVDWSNSVVVGWTDNVVSANYATVVWTNSRVNGNNSVALWKNSVNNANNSFLWTDGSRGELPSTVSNVFAVYWKHGMVVNAEKAHPLAQLTIGGPLVIHEWGNAVCGVGGENSWVVKVLNSSDSGYKCFCSCDGNGYWHSLYGQWRCEWYCNGDHERLPGCSAGSTSSDGVGGTFSKNQEDGKWVYEWSCNENSKPVKWMWAYVVDKEGKLHWTCQTDAGLTASCRSA